MKISIEMKRVDASKETYFRASANIVLDGVFIIRNARLLHTNRTFMVMPSIKGRRGYWFNSCHPITNDFRVEMENAFIGAYHDYLAENGMDDPDVEHELEPDTP